MNQRSLISNEFEFNLNKGVIAEVLMQHDVTQ